MKAPLSSVLSPSYVLEESLFRRNLALIRSIQEQAGVQFILAFKAFALWKVFPVVREYIPYSTASSLHEARLAFEEMGSLAHTYAPVYTPQEFLQIAQYSSHLSFNSLSQYQNLYPKLPGSGHRPSLGLRINPEYSEVGTLLYNPCAPGTRFGIPAHKLSTLPEGIEGLHFHTLCESNSYNLEKTLHVVEEKFGHLLPHIQWLNMGGGHLVTQKDYDVPHLIRLLKDFRSRYPQLQLILEPGSAFAWQTGFLLTTVIDIVEDQGIATALIDASFTCHMPDCLEMPYQPQIRGAHIGQLPGQHHYRIGGNSCLSGDFMGFWSFPQKLEIGQQLIFEDMLHYTTVKTTMFNGVHHPSIAWLSSQGELMYLKHFGYDDYKNRMC